MAKSIDTRSFEFEIQQLLLRGLPVGATVQTLFDRWDRLSHYEREVAALFMARAGGGKYFFDCLIHCLDKSQPFPWAALVEFFHSVETTTDPLSKEIINAILVGCGLENRLFEMSMSRGLDAIDPRFSKIREEGVQERRRMIEFEKNKMMMKLETLRADRLVDAEEDLLIEMIAKFPDDASLKERSKHLKQNQARRVLDKVIKRVRRTRNFTDPLERFRLQKNEMSPATSEELGYLMVEVASHHPEMALDIAVALMQMELPIVAKQALDFAPTTPSKDWLQLEIFIETRHFLEALELSHELEQKYVADPETAFSSSYARARALWGLGRTHEAIHSLQEIVNLRPHYRSAHSLLLDWKEQAV